jgi:alpha-L-fucosidase
MTQNNKSKDDVPIPTPAQYEWHEQERIMFVCIDPCTWQGREYDNHSFPLEKMNLPNLDTEQWCQAALSWGAKEILFVAKHTGGFCWWQTETTDYSVKNISWKKGKGNLLIELAKSCAKHNLSMGIYVYPGDESWGAGIGSGGKTKDPSKQEEYNEIFRTQLKEAITIASKYTRVIEVWFDGSCIIKVDDILKEYAPDAVYLQGPCANIRWVGNEQGKLPAKNAWSTLKKIDLDTGLSTQQNSDPHGDAWAPLEIDVPLYDHFWFWAAKNEKKRKSLSQLMDVYYQSAGNGAVMLLNSTPNTEGLIPKEDIITYRALGEEIQRRFSSPLAKTESQEKIIELNLGKQTKINHIILSEDIKYGERVQDFIIESWNKENNWKLIAQGGHIGRKTIIPFENINTSMIRVKINKHRGDLQTINLSAYFVEGYNHKIQEDIPSNYIKCGDWNLDGAKKQPKILKFDLTPFITHVGLWEIKFKPKKRRKIALSNAILYQSQQESTPGILTQPSKYKPIFHFNRTAVITEDAKIEFEVNMKGRKNSGILMIKPLN